MARKTVLWVLVLGMFCCQALLGALSSSAAAPGQSAIVAQWKGGDVTVQEFVDWWQYGTGPDRKPLTTLAERQEFLDVIINAELMMEEAESLGITKLPTVADFSRGRRVSSIVEMLQVRATEGRVNVPQRDIDDIYGKRLTEMDIKQIVVRTEAEARALIDSARAGVPFEDLAARYSTSPTGEEGGAVGRVKWGDFSDRWSAQAYRLEPGQISDPFVIQGGYCILKSYGKTLVEPADPAGEKDHIKAQLERDIIIRERAAYIDSLKTAYNYSLDINPVINLCAKYAVAMAGVEERTVIDDDIHVNLSDAERSTPLVTFTGKALTTGAMDDIIHRTPYQVRPRVDDPDDLVPFIEKQATDSLMVAEGEKLGLDEDPEVVRAVQKAYRRKTLYAFYSYVTRDAVIPEEDLRAFYDSNRERYNMPEGYTISKVVVNTKEAADSVIMRIRGGEAFEDIARVRSRDPFTAPAGGDVGFLSVGQDTEFDGFLATMEVNDIKPFRSLEGYVVLWLRDRQARRAATYEEAVESIKPVLLEKYREPILQKWIADRRAERGVTVNTGMLEALVLPT